MRFKKIIKTISTVLFHEIFSSKFLENYFLLYAVYYLGTLPHAHYSYIKYIFMNFFIVFCALHTFELMALTRDKNSKIYYEKIIAENKMDSKNLMFSYFISCIIITVFYALPAEILFIRDLYHDVIFEKYFITIGSSAFILNVLFILFCVSVNTAIILYDYTQLHKQKFEALKFPVLFIILIFISISNIKFIIYPYALPDPFLNLINYKPDFFIAGFGVIIYTVAFIFLLRYILKKSEMIFTQEPLNNNAKRVLFSKMVTLTYFMIMIVLIFYVFSISRGYRFFKNYPRTTICDPVMAIRSCGDNMGTISYAFDLLMSDEKLKTSEVTVNMLFLKGYLKKEPVCLWAKYKDPFNKNQIENYSLTPDYGKTAKAYFGGITYPVKIYCRAHGLELEQIIKRKYSKKSEDYFK